MSILSNLMGDKKRKTPLRHRRTPFMNLAFGKLPTAIGFWDVDPAGLEMLTDEEYITSITTAGQCKTVTPVAIKVDLGQVFEVYDILIHSGDGGYLSAADNTGTLKLMTGVTDSIGDATERDNQTTVSTTYVPITVTYEGEGIPVRYVFLELVGDDTREQYLKPAEIEVFGC